MLCHAGEDDAEGPEISQTGMSELANQHASGPRPASIAQVPEAKREEQLAEGQNYAPQSISPPLPAKDQGRVKEVATIEGVPEERSAAKSDSEAETIVLLEKDHDILLKEHKVIRHGEKKADKELEEGNMSPRRTAGAVNGGVERALESSRRASKSDAGEKEETNAGAARHDVAVSSGLSSARSSPPARLQPPKEDTSDNGQERLSVDRAQTSEPVHNSRITPRKRKLDDGGASDGRRSNSRRRGSQRSVEVKDHELGYQHKESTVVTRLTSAERSPSPGSNPYRKTTYTKSSLQPPNGASSIKHGLPPLITGREAKLSDEVHSDSYSASDSSHHPAHPGTLTPGDPTAVSPVKMAPHKKQRDQIGRTFLARACAAGEVENVRSRLVERPGDIDLADNAGNTPLQIASLEGSAEIVRVLIDHGADIECKNNEKDTPLIDAVENGHLEVVRLLLSAGANPRQGNLNGEEPMELLDSDNENYEAIRSALISANKSWLRRQSEDHYHHIGPSATREAGSTTSRGASATSPRHSPPVTNPRSPPATGIAPRRKTVRSEATRNDLLWMKPTAENLRDRAGKGDMPGVATILNVLPRADSESLIAAARGGHDEVIQLLLGIGGADADSKPIETYKPGFNTPMLAAIGRGNEKVIQLLLDQPKFDATRKDHRGYTYYEIAKERQGLNWETEYDILRQAYDKATKSDKPKSGQSLPKVSENKRANFDTVVESKERNGSHPLSAQASAPKKQVSSPPQRNVDAGSTKGSHERRNSERDLFERTIAKGHRSSHEPAVARYPQSRDADSMERSRAILDKSSKPTNNSTKEDRKPSRRHSDAVAVVSEGEATKPRRKLVSGKVMKGDLGKQRRASNISTRSGSSEPKNRSVTEDTDSGKSRKNRPPKLARGDVSNAHRSPPVKSENQRISLTVDEKNTAHQTTPHSNRQRGSKRLRNSLSPPQAKLPVVESSKAPVNDLEQKRPRLESERPSPDVNHPKKDLGGGGSSHVGVARMVRSPEEIAATGGYMHLSLGGHVPGVGQSPSEQHRTAAKERRKEADGKDATNDLRHADPSKQGLKASVSFRESEVNVSTPATAEKSTGYVQEQEELAKLAEEENKRQAQLLRQRAEKAQQEQAQSRKRAKEKAEECRQRLEAQHHKQLQAEKEEAERKLREAEEARREERRRAEEAEKQERKAREEEQARAEKRRHEWEAQQQVRAEQERLRREEAERRRAEQEEREKLEFLRRQEEQELLRREALPYVLQRIAELPSDRRQTEEEALRHMPLFTIKLRELVSDCSGEEAEEDWMPNFQAAAILGITDLTLSQCKLLYRNRLLSHT